MSKPANISLLYVEDEAGIRNSVARSLAFVADNISTAENGVEALRFLESNDVDLIVTDIRMPKMDGLSFIDRLRKEGVETPVVITSAFNETDYLMKAIDLKVDKFINKPIRIKDLLEVTSRLAETVINKRQLRIRQQELEHYRQAVNRTNYVIRAGRDGSVIETNAELDGFLKMHHEGTFVLKALADLFSEETVAEILEYASAFKILNKTVALQIGENRFTVILTAFASILQEEQVEEISIMLSDITPVVKEKEETIRRLYTDELTGLPNRRKLFNDLNRDETSKALWVVDIENFSKINHFYGFEAGDEILAQMAKLLQDYWPDDRPRTVYRSDTDHFVILCDKMEHFDKERAEALAKMLMEHIESHGFEIGKTLMIEIGVTIGASCLGEDDLFTEASMALEIAKDRKLSYLCFGDLEGIRESFENNLNMQRKIKTALQQEGFINYYQPIVDADGNLIKYESLIRMRDPLESGRVLTPYHFLDVARQSKNYPLITRRVIQNAFRDMGDGFCAFSINLSFDDIANPETTMYLEEMLQSHPKAGVTLEILESEGLKDPEQTIAFFHRMKGYGAKIAIDDFGSGYSNFAYFFDMPLDILKIDGSVVKRVHEYRGYIAIETIVRFAENLGVKTVAEFVEDESIFDKLKTLGVTMYQGYYFAPPKPLEEL
jgi:diguanylate cyclase (GGDEF)-like protein